MVNRKPDLVLVEGKDVGEEPRRFESKSFGEYWHVAVLGNLGFAKVNDRAGPLRRISRVCGEFDGSLGAPEQCV